MAGGGVPRPEYEGRYGRFSNGAFGFVEDLCSKDPELLELIGSELTRDWQQFCYFERECKTSPPKLGQCNGVLYRYTVSFRQRIGINCQLSPVQSNFIYARGAVTNIELTDYVQADCPTTAPTRIWITSRGAGLNCAPGSSPTQIRQLVQATPGGFWELQISDPIAVQSGFGCAPLVGFVDNCAPGTTVCTDPRPFVGRGRYTLREWWRALGGALVETFIGRAAGRIVKIGGRGILDYQRKRPPAPVFVPVPRPRPARQPGRPPAKPRPNPQPQRRDPRRNPVPRPQPQRRPETPNPRPWQEPPRRNPPPQKPPKRRPDLPPPWKPVVRPNPNRVPRPNPPRQTPQPRPNPRPWQPNPSPQPRPVAPPVTFPVPRPVPAPRPVPVPSPNPRPVPDRIPFPVPTPDRPPIPFIPYSPVLPPPPVPGLNPVPRPVPNPVPTPNPTKTPTPDPVAPPITLPIPGVPPVPVPPPLSVPVAPPAPIPVAPPSPVPVPVPFPSPPPPTPYFPPMIPPPAALPDRCICNPQYITIVKEVPVMIPGAPGRDGRDGQDGKDGKSMEFIDAQVLIADCTGSGADAVPIQVPVLKNEEGQTNAALYQAIFSEMLKLRIDGQISCPAAPDLRPLWEYVGTSSEENPVWISPEPIYFEMSGVAIELLGDIPPGIRYFVLAGEQTEMAVGSVSFVDQDDRQYAPYTQISTRQTRIMRPRFDNLVPEVRVRLSLKPGISFRVFDPGDRWTT